MGRREVVRWGAVAGAVALLVGIALAVWRIERGPRLVAYFGERIDGLSIGAPVRFMGLDVGRVVDIRINLAGVERRPGDLRIPVVIELDEKRLQHKGVRSDLRRRETVDELVQRGLRAQLASEGMLGRRRHIALDLRPDTPAARSAGRDAPYPEIPTVPGNSGPLGARTMALMDQLEEVDVVGLATDVRSLIADLRPIVRSPDLQRALAHLDELTEEVDATMRMTREVLGPLRPGGPVGKNLRSASEQATQLLGQGTRTLSVLDRQLAPTGPLASQIQETLGELQLASRSARRLTEQMRRYPGIVLGGRGSP